MYNADVKERFLENYAQSTQMAIKRIFLKSALYENALGKDLYEFNMEEIESLMYDFNPLTLAASTTIARMISSYFNWGIKHGYRTNNINPLSIIPHTYFKKFVTIKHPLYVTNRQLQQIEDYCNNAQDAVIFRLLFEGVQGQGCSELTNLKKQDVDFTNKKLFLTDNLGNARELDVSTRCVAIIKEALAQKHYAKKNGESAMLSHLPPTVALIDNDYVIRTNITNINNVQEANKFTIYRRIASVREALGHHNLTVKNIARSGMLYLAAQKYFQTGTLLKGDVRDIADRFKTSIYLLKDHINEENINALYLKGDAINGL